MCAIRAGVYLLVGWSNDAALDPDSSRSVVQGKTAQAPHFTRCSSCNFLTFPTQLETAVLLALSHPSTCQNRPWKLPDGDDGPRGPRGGAGSGRHSGSATAALEEGGAYRRGRWWLRGDVSTTFLERFPWHDLGVSINLGGSMVGFWWKISWKLMIWGVPLLQESSIGWTSVEVIWNALISSETRDGATRGLNWKPNRNQNSRWNQAGLLGTSWDNLSLKLWFWPPITRGFCRVSLKQSTSTKIWRTLSLLKWNVLGDVGCHFKFQACNWDIPKQNELLNDQESPTASSRNVSSKSMVMACPDCDFANVVTQNLYLVFFNLFVTGSMPGNIGKSCSAAACFFGKYVCSDTQAGRIVGYIIHMYILSHIVPLYPQYIFLSVALIAFAPSRWGVKLSQCHGQHLGEPMTFYHIQAVGHITRRWLMIFIATLPSKSSHLNVMLLMFWSHDYPVIIPWLSHDYPMIIRWFSTYLHMYLDHGTYLRRLAILEEKGDQKSQRGPAGGPR